MNPCRFVVAHVAVLAACAGAPPADTARSAAAVHGSAATTEFKPRAAFRAYAAKVLGVPPSELNGGANTAKAASAEEHARGRAWPFAMWHKEDTYTAVRGWVTAEGTVITAKQDLGILFVEAGLWTAPPRHTPAEFAYLLAGDLVWSYGVSDELVTLNVWGLAPPKLELGPDGSGSLRFFSNDHGGAIPGMGGGSPPDVYWENNVVLTADHHASLTKTSFETTSGR